MPFHKTGPNSKAKVLAINAGFGAADGLIRDANGSIYVSDWAGGKVWKLTEPKTTPQLFTEGHKSAADISLSNDGKSILMPDMVSGELVTLPIK